MSIRFASLAVVSVLFFVLTALAVRDVGYFGIITPHFRSLGAGQVLADLVIMCTLSCFWMVSDARSRGLNAWPFVLVTLVAGSFGPLSYLMFRELKSGALKSQAV